MTAYSPGTAAYLILVAFAAALTAVEAIVRSGGVGLHAGSPGLQRLPALQAHLSRLPEGRAQNVGAVLCMTASPAINLRGGGPAKDTDEGHDRTSFSGNYHWIPVGRARGGVQECKSEMIGEDNSKFDRRPAQLLRSKSFLGESLLNPDLRK